MKCSDRIADNLSIAINDVNQTIPKVDIDKETRIIGLNLSVRQPFIHHYHEKYSKLRNLISRISFIKLDRKSLMYVINMKLIPTAAFGFHTTAVSHSKLRIIQQMISKCIKNAMSLPTHMNNDILYSPLKFGGLGFNSFKDFVETTRLQNIIYCLNSNNIIFSSLSHYVLLNYQKFTCSSSFLAGESKINVKAFQQYYECITSFHVLQKTIIN